MKLKRKYNKTLFKVIYGQYSIDTLNRERILKIYHKLKNNETVTKNQLIDFIEYLTNVMNNVWNTNPSLSLDLSEIISFFNKKLIKISQQYF